MNIGSKISQCRKTAGISQEKLAERLGISRQAVSRWETGEAVPDVEKVVLLSHVFGVSTDYLLLDEQQTAFAPGAAPEAPREDGHSDAVRERRRRFRIAFGLGLLILGMLTAVAALILAGIWAAYATEWWTSYGRFGTGLLKTWRLGLLIAGIALAIAGGFVLAWEYRRTD